MLCAVLYDCAGWGSILQGKFQFMLIQIRICNERNNIINSFFIYIVFILFYKKNNNIHKRVCFNNSNKKMFREMNFPYPNANRSAKKITQFGNLKIIQK